MTRFSTDPRRARRLPAGALLATALTLAPGICSAQSAADQGGSDVLQEVIVTARRTAENLQETPISITALSADDIAARGLDNILDVGAQAPSLDVMPGGNYSGKSAITYIRGVGQDQFTYAFEPGVGFYVDDVYYGSVYGSIFDLADISNLQVLRGPQGTLFGKNNEGGAILLYTAEPKGDDSGDFEAGYGSYSREFLKGNFDIPLIGDQLALRVSAAHNSMDGYVQRLDFACAHPGEAGNLRPATTGGCEDGTEGGEDVTSLSAALRWKPSDDFSVLLRTTIMNDRSEAGAEDTLIQKPAEPGSPTAIYNQYVALPLYGAPVSSPLYVTGNPFTSYSSYTNPGTGYSVPPVNDEYFRSVSGVVEWQTPWQFHVKNILAYQEYTSEFANTDGTPIPTYLEDNVLDHHQVSEELQLSGKLFADRLDWIAGAYYYDARGLYGGHIELPSTILVGPGVLPFAPNGAYGLNFDLHDLTTERTTSGFLHGVYRLTQQFSVELGARYSTEEKSQSYDHVYTASVPLDVLTPPGTLAYPPGAGGRTGLARTDPKLSLQYQWTPDFMTYAQVSTGYKSGGINPKPVLESDIKPFNAEHLVAYELGAKTEWLGHRLILNADTFLSDYRQLQLSEFLPPPIGDGGTIIVNTGHARIEGVEMDLQARPIHPLSLDAGLSYLNYHTVELGAAAGQVGGPTDTTRPPYIPRWKGSLGAQYEFDLAEAGSVTVRADETLQSLVYFDLANTPAGAQPGYALLNLRLAWSDAARKWTAALEVRNAADRLYYSFKIPTLNADGTLFTVNGTPGLPRTEFFTIERHFR